MTKMAAGTTIALGFSALLASLPAGATEKPIPAHTVSKSAVIVKADAQKASACPSTLATLLTRLTALQAKQAALQQELTQILSLLRSQPAAATGEFTGEGSGLR